MTSAAIDVDQVLKSLASQSIKQGSDVRVAVRNLTLKALQQRELTLDQIGKVLRSVTEGVTLGVARREIKVEKALSDTVAGMDDALLEAVEASNVALHRLTGDGCDYEDSNLKKALDELERLKAPWDVVLEKTRRTGTATGTQVASTLRDYARRAQAAMRVQRETGFKTAHLLTQNFAILASGILIGMSEGLGARPAAATRRAKPAAAKRKAGPAAAKRKAKPAPRGRLGTAAKSATAKAGKRPAAKTAKRPAAKTAKRPAAKTAKRPKAAKRRRSVR